MRTEITYWRANFIKRRIDYVLDKDQKHRAKGLTVVSWGLGRIKTEKDARRLFRELLNESRGRVGAPKQIGVYEITAHAVDSTGSTRAFRGKESLTLAMAFYKALNGQAGLAADHGNSDFHLLVANYGPGGYCLKEFLPNRSNPRRVMVAVADRVEKELNLERKKNNLPLLLTMEEVRARNRKQNKRFIDEVARKLPDKKVPTISDILEAIRQLGHHVIKRKRCIEVTFAGGLNPVRIEQDLFMRGIERAWLRTRKYIPREKVGGKKPKEADKQIATKPEIKTNTPNLE